MRYRAVISIRGVDPDASDNQIELDIRADSLDDAMAHAESVAGELEVYTEPVEG